MDASLADPAEREDDLVGALRAAGCVFAEDEAAVLREAAPDEVHLALMTARRVAGEPLEQVVGWAEFRGLRVAVEPGVFVPRRRTERVAELAVHFAQQVEQPVMVDLCCGAGAIAMVVEAEVPHARVHAADIDPAACAVARRNLRGPVHEGDLYDALPRELTGRVDILAVNAPYVPTGQLDLMPREARLHEHLVALDGGADGLDVHRRVAEQAAEWLAPGGSLLLETSPRQATSTARWCRSAGLSVTIYTNDQVRVVRAISGPSTPSGTITG